MNDRNLEEQSTGRAKWSAKNCFWCLVVIVSISAAFVVVLMDKAVWVELELLAVVLGITMTAFYTWILYHGVRFRDDERIELPFLCDLAPIESGGYTPGGILAGVDDPIGCIIAIFLEVLFFLFITFALALLLWVGINLVAISLFLIALPLFYVFQRSIYYVLLHQKDCHHRLFPSLMYAAAYALAKTVLICLFIYGAHEIVQRILF